MKKYTERPDPPVAAEPLRSAIAEPETLSRDFREMLRGLQPKLMSRTLDETEWAQYICDDLIPILTLLRQQYGARVYEVIHDLKGVYTDVYLEEKIPGQAIEQIMREFSSNENLRVGDGWVACGRDYCSIGPGESKEMVRGKSALKRLRDFFARAFKGGAV